ncbi:MAG: hypothetical protein ACRD3W_03150 [Terriglobales bacterium]
MAEPSDKANQTEELIKMLIERKLVSPAQADLARADMEVNGMTLDEVLLARRWITEEALLEIAPWLLKNRFAPAATSAYDDQSAPAQAGGDGNKTGNSTASSNNFEENLEKYRDLMDNILGEANS